MQDFFRLLVGVSLLGLAIFLSFQHETVPVTPENDTTAAANTQTEFASHSNVMTTREASPTATGQDPLPAYYDGSKSAPITAAGVGLPQIDGLKSLNGNWNAPAALQSPPQFSDQYEPLQAIRDQANRGLVPIQPKPALSSPRSHQFVLHRTQPGETLQAISTTYFGTADRYLDIYQLNRSLLNSPDAVPENLELRIPQ